MNAINKNINTTNNSNLEITKKIRDRFCEERNDKSLDEYKEKEKIWFCHEYNDGKKRDKHYWIATKEQAKRSGGKCPICERTKRPDVKKGFNDFKTMCPDLAKNFISVDPNQFKTEADKKIGSKNKIYDEKGYIVKKTFKTELAADEISYMSPIKFLWKCPVCGNVNSTEIRQISKLYDDYLAGTLENNGCKHCQAIAGKGGTCVPGVNDLQTKRPDLAKEFNQELNKISPSEVSWKSTRKKYYWNCSKHGVYKATVGDRVHFGTGCQKCAGKVVTPGENDLLTYCQQNQLNHLIKAYSRNNEKPMSEVFPYGREKIKWICSSCGKEYMRDPGHMIRSPWSLCEDCNPTGTSFPELAILLMLQKCLAKERIEHRKKVNGSECDILLDDKLAIEYNGYLYHRAQGDPDKKRTMKKVHDFKADGKLPVVIEEYDPRETFSDKCTDKDKDISIVDDGKFFLIKYMPKKEQSRPYANLYKVVNELLKIYCSSCTLTYDDFMEIYPEVDSYFQKAKGAKKKC